MTNGELVDSASRERTAESVPTLDDGFAHKPWLLALLLVISTFVAYQPVWRAGFIWDDDDHLTANPAMTAPHGLRMIWSSLAVSRYYPLTLTTFWIQRRVWGLNPLPYHLVNVALHAINGVLVYFVLRRLRIPAAWLAAMLWVLHPVNVESVAWVTELKNAQSGVFFFLALLCFLQGNAAPQRRWYVMSLVCGLAALVSKPSTVVLPLVLLLCVWWQRGSWRRADILRIAPFFILALGMSALTVIEQRGQVLKAGTTEWSLGIPERLVIAGKAIWFYAVKVVWPMHLTFIYPRWEVDTTHPASWVPLAGVVAVGVVLWRHRSLPWCRAAMFGGGFFIVALAPVLGFFDVFYFHYSFVADHFQYLASIGLAALVASAGTVMCGRAPRWAKPFGPVAAAVALLALGALTWKQARIYQDAQTVWQDTIAKNPKCWMAHLHIGLYQLGLGNAREAMGQDKLALRLKPDYAEAHNNLAIVLARMGKLQEAIEQWEQALQLKPNFAEAHNNLGAALMRQGRPQEAIGHYEQALRLKPDYAEAHNNLGNALFRLGEVQEAIEHWQQALRIKPDYADAHYNLGIALEQTGKIQEAIQHYEQALRIQPDFVQAQSNLARARAVR